VCDIKVGVLPLVLVSRQSRNGHWFSLPKNTQFSRELFRAIRKNSTTTFSNLKSGRQYTWLTKPFLALLTAIVKKWKTITMFAVFLIVVTDLVGVVVKFTLQKDSISRGNRSVATVLGEVPLSENVFVSNLPPYVGVSGASQSLQNKARVSGRDGILRLIREIRCQNGNAGDLGIIAKIGVLGRKFHLVEFLRGKGHEISDDYLFGECFSHVGCRDCERSGLVWFDGSYGFSGCYPSALLQTKLFDGGIQGCFALGYTGFQGRPVLRNAIFDRFGDSIGFGNEFIVLPRGPLRTFPQYGQLKNSRSSIEESTESHEDAGHYERLVVKSGLFPSLNKHHLVCLLAVLCGLASCLFLMLNIYFFEGSTAQLFIRIIFFLVTAVASAIIFYLTLPTLLTIQRARLSQDALGNQNELNGYIHSVPLACSRSDLNTK